MIHGIAIAVVLHHQMLKTLKDGDRKVAPTGEGFPIIGEIIALVFRLFSLVVVDYGINLGAQARHDIVDFFETGIQGVFPAGDAAARPRYDM